MTAPSAPSGPGEGDKPFGFTDKRKIHADAEGVARPDPPADDPLAGLDFDVAEFLGGASQDALAAAQAQAAEHLDALQRERASFTNYRNRALRDQEAARVKGIEDVLTALLPVLDATERARAHGELEGPMAAIATQLDEALAKFGVERYGEVGEAFDPHVHEAFMHRESDDAAEPTIELVIEPGYRIGEKVVRAARVGVVGPA